MGLSRAKVKELFELKQVRVNGRLAKKVDKVQRGQTIQVTYAEEPTGAVAPAAARFRAHEADIAGRQGTVVAVVSGGNVDPEMYRRLLESPLPAAG